MQQRRRHTEPLDTLQDRCEQLSWKRHLSHLERHEISDAIDAFWKLDESDGQVAAGQTVVVVRRNRPMWLNNNGDTIKLIAPDGKTSGTKTYGKAASGQLFLFD